MIDLDETYKRLARPWTPEELAEHYHAAQRIGAELVRNRDDVPDRPITLLATAIPPSAALSVAVHVLHAVPAPATSELAERLLTTAETNTADALQRCHRALELDGANHAYTPYEWLPVVYDTSAALLQSSRLDHEPPSVVRQAQDAVRWLSAAIANLDASSPEAPPALADALARLLVVHLFAEAGRGIGSSLATPRSL